tara:strand:- start:979 stop:1134 length:156 start_codon:yes stop_codon:yes gene_type:complete
MAMELTKEQMKERVFNYLEYMEEKDMQEIAAQLYNISKRRDEVKRRQEDGR